MNITRIPTLEPYTFDKYSELLTAKKYKAAFLPAQSLFSKLSFKDHHNYV